jgi:hypothetical protein
MGQSFEWADVDGRRKADIWNDVELTLVSDASKIEPGTIGVSMDTGSDGVMLWGTQKNLLAWAENVVARLRAGEGKSGYGEAREFVFADRFYLVQDADGEVYEAGQLNELYRLRDNSADAGEDPDSWPALQGDTWQVMGPGAPGVASNGQVGFVVHTRKVIDS